MRLLALALSIPALAACSTLPDHHESSAHDDGRDPSTVNFNVYAGQRNVDDSDWDPVDEQMVFGIEVDKFDPHESFGWEMALFYASDSGNDFGGSVDATTTEISFGIRKTFNPTGRFRPYIGAGLAGLRAELDSSVGDDEDNTAGGYAHGGVYWELGQNFHVGVDVRALLGTDVSLSGGDADVDYVQGAVFGGLAF